MVPGPIEGPSRPNNLKNLRLDFFKNLRPGITRFVIATKKKKRFRPPGGNGPGRGTAWDGERPGATRLALGQGPVSLRGPRVDGGRASDLWGSPALASRAPRCLPDPLE